MLLRGHREEPTKSDWKWMGEGFLEEAILDVNFVRWLKVRPR